MRRQDRMTIMRHALITAFVLELPQRHFFHVTHYESHHRCFQRLPALVPQSFRANILMTIP